MRIRQRDQNADAAAHTQRRDSLRSQLHRRRTCRRALSAAANLSANPFASMTTVTYQIVQLLTGDQEFDSAKTLSAFALGLVLFVVTLVLNIIALNVVKRFREAYE